MSLYLPNDRAVGQTCAEAYDTHFHTLMQPALLIQLVESDGDAGTGNVAEALDVGVDLCGVCAEQLGRLLDDAQICLMGDDDVDVVDTVSALLMAFTANLYTACPSDCR